MPSRGLGSKCIQCQECKVRCSHTQGHVKRRLEDEQGGLVTKRPRTTEGPSRRQWLEECKVQALEAIVIGLDRLTSVMERVEEETRLCGDLAALQAFKEAKFPIGDVWELVSC